MSESTPLENAVLLIATFISALENGFKHTALDGRPLNTVKDILVALTNDGEIHIEEPS